MTVLNIRGRDNAKSLAITATAAAVPGITFTVVAGRDARVTAVEAVADAGGAVTRRVLCNAPIGEIVRAAWVQINESTDAWRRLQQQAVEAGQQVEPHSLLGRLARDSGALSETFAEKPRPGRGGRGDDAYAAVAAQYVAALTEPNPVQVVAAATGLSAKAVRNLLFKARERGLLTSPGQGRAGGELTPKARRILNGER